MSLWRDVFQSTYPTSWVAQSMSWEISHRRPWLWSTNNTGHWCWYVRKWPLVLIHLKTLTPFIIWLIQWIFDNRWCRQWDLSHDNLLHNIVDGNMLGKATRGRKRMELLHDMMEGRDYGQLKYLVSDRSRWRQENKWECMSETYWKWQRTKEEDIDSPTAGLCF